MYDPRLSILRPLTPEATNPAAGLSLPILSPIGPSGAPITSLPAFFSSDPSSGPAGPPLDATGGVPGPPQYASPNLLQMPKPGFGLLAARGLAQMGPLVQHPYESPASRGIRGLLHGLAAGYSGAAMQSAATDEANRAATNAVEVGKAATINKTLEAQYTAKLTDYYKTKANDRGQVQISPEMVKNGLYKKDMLGKWDSVGSVKKAQDDARTVEPQDSALLAGLAQAGTITKAQATAGAVGLTAAERSKLLTEGVPKSSGGGVFGSMISEMDPKAVASEIVAGRMVPDLSSYGRPFQSAVASILARDYKFDYMRANTDYKSVQRHFMSANTGLQLRFQQAIDNAMQTTPVLSDLNDQLTKVAPRFAVTPLNMLANTAAKEGLGTPEATAAATKMYALATALQFELAVVYQGGGVPTDQAMKRASSIIDPNASPKRIAAQIAIAERELTMRQNAINNAGPVSPSNPAGQNSSGGSLIGSGLLSSTKTSPQPPGAPAANEPVSLKAAPVKGVRFRRSDGVEAVLTDPAMIASARKDGRYREVK